MELETKYLPYHVLKDAGCEPHWNDDGYIKVISHQRRFHAKIIGDNKIDLHLDEVVSVNGKNYHLSNSFKIEASKPKYKRFTSSDRISEELNRIKKFD
jgi:hypothetical protein